MNFGDPPGFNSVRLEAAEERAASLRRELERLTAIRTAGPASLPDSDPGPPLVQYPPLGMHQLLFPLGQECGSQPGGQRLST